MNTNINEANKNNGITGNLGIIVAPEDDGLYVCRLSRSPEMQVTGTSLADIICDGQTPEHALAIGLEQLAAEYRRLAEESQAIPALAVEKTAAGNVIEKYFHVTVHFEGILRDESKFEVIHNTLVGNKVVENAEVTAIAIDPRLHVAQAERWINEEDDDDDE
jgi:hypothetical protein